MKKKHREIIVNNQKFGYIVRGDGKERHVAIYRDKKPIFATTWRVQTVTPKDIEEIITKHVLVGSSIR
jgi:hypothetical protein